MQCSLIEIMNTKQSLSIHVPTLHSHKWVYINYFENWVFHRLQSRMSRISVLTWILRDCLVFIISIKLHCICLIFGKKKCRGVMPLDTEDWCKIWTKTDLLFQNWEEFGEFWSRYSKVSKICTLIGPFSAKYIIFDLKKYWGVIFYDTEE